MSSIGPIALEDESSQEVFLGGGMIQKLDHTETVADRIDDQVQAIINHCELKAIEIIKQNRTVLDLLVDTLIEKETLNGPEFRDILSQYTEIPEQQDYVSRFLIK